MSRVMRKPTFWFPARPRGYKTFWDQSQTQGEYVPESEFITEVIKRLEYVFTLNVESDVELKTSESWASTCACSTSDSGFKMAAHIRRQREHRRILGNFARRPRLFRDISNPLEDLDPEEVFKRYRFRPPTILYILEIILPVQRPTNRNCPLPPLLQLLLCLRFLAYSFRRWLEAWNFGFRK